MVSGRVIYAGMPVLDTEKLPSCPMGLAAVLRVIAIARRELLKQRFLSAQRGHATKALIVFKPAGGPSRASLPGLALAARPAVRGNRVDALRIEEQLVDLLLAVIVRVDFSFAFVLGVARRTAHLYGWNAA